MISSLLVPLLLYVFGDLIGVVGGKVLTTFLVSRGASPATVAAVQSLVPVVQDLVKRLNSKPLTPEDKEALERHRRTFPDYFGVGSHY